jgi:hypothetical protein
MISVEDANSLMEFDDELTDDSLIECIECETWSGLDEWKESETGCDTCGTHQSFYHESCGANYDSINPEPLCIKNK